MMVENRPPSPRRLGGPRLAPEQYRRLARILRQETGIELGDGKQSLVGYRLAGRLRELDLDSFDSYLSLIQSSRGGSERRRFVETMVTSFTGFFREVDHFRRLHHAVRRWVGAGRRRLRLWAAAAATGEEAYSMAITALEASRGVPVDLKVLGTDISTRSLGLARRGVYGRRQIAAVPLALRRRYFESSERSETGEPQWRVAPVLRQVVIFRRLNLARPPFPMSGPIDAIFCRNLWIYFGQAERQALVDELERILHPDGWLFVGHAETLSGLQTNGLVQRAPSVYRVSPSSGDTDGRARRSRVESDGEVPTAPRPDAWGHRGQ